MHTDLPPVDRAGDAEKRARKRAREIRDFYSHLASYLVVNVLLIGLNLLTSPGTFWAIWPLMGWGIGILSHAVSVFGLFGIGSREWEERKVQELMMKSQQLTAEEVRQMLRQELPAAASVDTERIVRRLEHLEAIVTSRDWDLLDDREPTARPGDPPLADEEPSLDEGEIARLARRVR